MLRRHVWNWWVALLMGATACKPQIPDYAFGPASAGQTGSAGSGGSAGKGAALGNNSVDNPTALTPQPRAGSNASNAATGSAGDTQACAQTAQEAQRVPVDMYIMLDRSASMTGAAGNDATGVSLNKWDAVRSAIAMFLSDSRSDGLGVGLQYFPLVKEGVPEECSTDAQCGTAGPCFNGICEPSGGDSFVLALCSSDSDCPPDYLGCTRTVGQCSGAPSLICFDIGIGGCGLQGSCQQVRIPGTCANADSCEAAEYAIPAVAIASLPDNAVPLILSLEAEVTVGRTPTAAALSGALDNAKDYAQQHADHRVIALLATDGLPTECEPSDARGIGTLASDALAGTPSVATYVIGVFAAEDVEARSNVDGWAAAGGTERAFIVDPAGDVSRQFLDALDEIRSGNIACEYQLPPAPAGSSLDLHRVNVAWVEGKDSRDFLYVGEEDRCGVTELGWHYDKAPGSGKATKIVVCDGACDTLKTSAHGRVEVRVGCQTKGPD